MKKTYTIIGLNSDSKNIHNEICEKLEMAQILLEDLPRNPRIVAGLILNGDGIVVECAGSRDTIAIFLAK
jgi:hypothetical protein